MAIVGVREGEAKLWPKLPQCSPSFRHISLGGLGKIYYISLPHCIASLLGYMLQHIVDLGSAVLEAGPVLSILAFLSSQLYFECLFW